MSAGPAGGCRVHVFIATTEGPVAVQKITAEDPDVPSVVCLDGTTEILAISRDYTRFVDRGTGLVARLTGHGAYRLDLDRPVDGGRSWQLPVLLAHLLEAEDCLAAPEEPADLTLLATGEVDREQRVRPVGRLDRKLSAARTLIDRHAKSGRPLVVLVPDDGEAHDLLASQFPPGDDGVVHLIAWRRVEGLAALEVRPAREEALSAVSLANEAPPPRSRTPLAQQGNPLEVTSASDTPVAGPDDEAADANPGPVLQPALQLFSPPSTQATDTPNRGRTVRKQRLRVFHRTGGLLIVLLVLMGAGTVGWWTGPRHWEALRRAGDYVALDRSLHLAFFWPLAERYRVTLKAKTPPAESLVFSVVERRTSDGNACSAQAVHEEDLVETSLDALKSGFFRSQRGMSLCQVVYRVANESEHLAYLYFGVRPVFPARADSKGVGSLLRAAALPRGASLTLDLDLGQQPIAALGADLLILAVPSPAPQLRRAFEAAMSGEETTVDTSRLDLTALPDLGLTVKGASHAILR